MRYLEFLGLDKDMNFKKWLLSEAANIRFAGWIKDGRVIVYIDGVRYVYIVDAIHHQRLKNMARRASGRALNEIKRMVRAGQATQEEPPPAPQAPPPTSTPPPDDPPPTQGTLF